MLLAQLFDNSHGPLGKSLSCWICLVRAGSTTCRFSPHRTWLRRAGRSAIGQHSHERQHRLGNGADLLVDVVVMVEGIARALGRLRAAGRDHVGDAAAPLLAGLARDGNVRRSRGGVGLGRLSQPSEPGRSPPVTTPPRPWDRDTPPRSRGPGPPQSLRVASPYPLTRKGPAWRTTICSPSCRPAWARSSWARPTSSSS